MGTDNLTPGFHIRGRYVPTENVDIELTNNSYIVRLMDTIDALSSPYIEG